MKDEEADARAVNAEPHGSRCPAWSSGSAPNVSTSSLPPAIEPKGCPAPIALLRAPGRCCITMAGPSTLERHTID